jgi:hypothetical protein
LEQPERLRRPKKPGIAKKAKPIRAKRDGKVFEIILSLLLIPILNHPAFLYQYPIRCLTLRHENP